MRTVLNLAWAQRLQLILFHKQVHLGCLQMRHEKTPANILSSSQKQTLWYSQRCWIFVVWVYAIWLLFTTLISPISRLTSPGKQQSVTVSRVWKTHDGNHPSPLGLVARREPNRRYTNKILTKSWRYTCLTQRKEFYLQSLTVSEVSFAQTQSCSGIKQTCACSNYAYLHIILSFWIGHKSYQLCCRELD